MLKRFLAYYRPHKKMFALDMVAYIFCGIYSLSILFVMTGYIIPISDIINAASISSASIFLCGL